MTGVEPIRAAVARDFPALQDLERAAGEMFREVGMPEIADDEPFSLDDLEVYRRVGLAWVAVDTDDHPVAYLVAEPVDGCQHVEQVSVHPDHSCRGLGRALLDYAGSQARASHRSALTLTTFTEIPWNAPYYARLGFRVLPEREWTPGLRAVRERERAHGLDRWPRVCMRRDLAE